jgi:FkbM family methyltransferase
MEGNACYKFSTIRNYIERTGSPPIRTALDVGANTGEITVLMQSFFPDAHIHAFEPVAEYCAIARDRTAHLPNVEVHNAALSAQHLYFDDLGAHARPAPQALSILKGCPGAGPGWVGGSVVLPSDDELISRPRPPHGYERLGQAVRAMTLDEALSVHRIDVLDLMKIDCEGCEHSLLGAAPLGTLRRIRFIVGEYHELPRFYRMLTARLQLTHKVNLIGSAATGCFFAERLDGTRDGILRYDKSGMLMPRPWLAPFPIDWNLFDERYVLPDERAFHALV